jgi:hypothetical protein
MNDDKFKKMDEAWMKKTEPLREKEVPPGILKGFATSVERRIASGAGTPSRKPAFRPLMVPALAVFVLAAFAAMRLPGMQMPAEAPLELAQAVSAEDLQEEIDVLKELGVWEEYEADSILAEEDVLAEEELELTAFGGSASGLV